MSEALGSESESLGRQVERTCNRFEDAWVAWTEGPRPGIEPYLEMVPEAGRLAVLHELILLDVAYRQRHGENPRPSEYQARFPWLNPDWIAREFPVAPAELTEPSPPPPGAVATAPGEMRLLGKFQLLERVGRGAFGVVWRARDIALDRIVALKIPHASTMTAEHELERFHREARAAAQLRHPGIVTVHEVQMVEGLPTIVSEFIEGAPLKNFLEVRRLTFSETARLLAEVAEAVDYAHSMGLVHRDLKPANIMIESVRPPLPTIPDRVGKPLVMDFGLALRGDGEATLTQEGHILGTPAYMSPEQAAGRSHEADRRSDVYSLGVVLYELLTGEPPFRGAKLRVLLQVQEEEPNPPRRINGTAPRDLETICLKVMAKAPNHRYATARELADDLRRYLQGEPIQARPLGSWEKIWKWVKRRPLAAGFVGVSAVAVLALVVVAVGWFYNNQLKVALQDARDQHARAERLRAETEHLAYLYGIALAQREWDLKNALKASELLDDCPRELRGWEHGYLRHLIGFHHPVFEGLNPVFTVAFGPDGLRLASGGTRGRVWDVAKRRQVFTLMEEFPIQVIAFSPDGRWLGTGDEEGIVKVWDAATGQTTLTIQGHDHAVNGLVFSPDGKRLVSGARGEGTLKIWNAATGQEIRTLTMDEDEVTSLTFSPNSKRLASGSLAGTLTIWNVDTGQEVWTKEGHASAIQSVAFSPDGLRLASGGLDRSVKIWDTVSSEGIQTFKGHNGRITSLAYSPDGKRLVSGGSDETLMVWDAVTGRVILTLKGHKGEVQSVAFSRDGKHLASGGRDGKVIVWDTAAGRKPVTIKLTAVVSSVAFGPDNQHLAGGCWDGKVRVWNVAEGQETLAFRGHNGPVTGVGFSPDSRRLASISSRDGKLKIWDAATGKETAIVEGQIQGVVSPVFSPDSKHLVSDSRDKTLKIWEAATGREFLTLQGHTDLVNCFAFRADGLRLVSGGGDGRLIVWDAATGQILQTILAHASGVNRAIFSPDDLRLVSSGGDRTLKVWDATTGQEIRTKGGYINDVTNLAFSPDGRRLVSGERLASTLIVSDPATGQEILILSGHTDEITSLAFSPDGKRLVSSGRDGTLIVWEAASDAENRDQ